MSISPAAASFQTTVGARCEHCLKCYFAGGGLLSFRCINCDRVSRVELWEFCEIPSALSTQYLSKFVIGGNLAPRWAVVLYCARMSRFTTHRRISEGSWDAAFESAAAQDPEFRDYILSLDRILNGGDLHPGADCLRAVADAVTAQFEAA